MVFILACFVFLRWFRWGWYNKCMVFLAGSGVSFEGDWHPTRNGELSPGSVSLGSKKKVWWLGRECGHEWSMSVDYRNRGFNCPVCVSLGVLVPGIAADWHPTRNGELTPYDFRANSGVKVWWLGRECGHEWDGDIRGRVRSGYGCPFCVNQRVLVGFNDLATTHPGLAKEWHPSKNGELLPTQVTYGSKKKVWWLGRECGHEWFSSISPRASKGVGCGVCRGLQTQVGVNDLDTTHPKLVEEWHPTLNGDLKSTDVTAGSQVFAWWKGLTCGHEWQASVGERVKGNGCLVCSNHKIVAGINDFATTHPAVSAEWHKKANGNYMPTEFSYGSNFKATWICSKGHTWVAKIADRCVKSSTCPQCAAATSVSKAEKEIASFCSDSGLETQTSVRNVIKGELDIYIPEKNIAVEFNGLYWHSEAAGKGKYYHFDKWKACKDKGIQLIQVWEDEYNRNPEQVKAMLAHKLGVTNQRKVFARRTEVVQLTAGQSNSFLNENHIQGAVDGGIRVGLIGKGTTTPILAVMVLKREPGTNGKTLTLLRFATSQPVVGGFTKLLHHVEKIYKPEEIVTFSDNCVSDGGLYEKNGFTAVKELPPDYMYVVRGERVHKFSYRLKRFREDPNLLFEEGLSERELAALNGLARIWDAGKTKWKKLLKP